jgi:predicted SAM-dependent methyltransferase
LYIDRVPASHWKTDPRFAKEKVVEVDIVDDGVELSTVAADHLDYLIAAHVLEHADNPIRALQNWLRVVKPGGHLIVIVPDMRHMWDHNREVTPLDHFFRDYEEGPTTSAADHYREIARRSMGWTDEEKIEEYVAINEPAVHFHTWTFESFLEFLVAVNKYLEHPYEVVEAQLNIGEAVAVLKVL